MLKRTIGAALALILDLGHACAADPLARRLAAPPPRAIERFAEAGMRDVRPHVLTPSERQRVETALASLPVFYRAVLERRLHRLSFVDGMAGQGSGLTSPAGPGGQFDLTLRASLIDESLSAFLTAKERRLFAADDSGHMVTIEASGADALTYVLLHEATHVADASLGITANLDSPLLGGIWINRKQLAPQLASSVAANTPFRAGPQSAVGDAVALYEALAQTPFVSLYATASAQEDLAELAAWNALQQRFQGTLAIHVTDADGKLLKRFEPLNFPAVRARMRGLEACLMELIEGNKP